MDYNKLIENLIKECQQKLNRDKYDKYSSILEKLEASLSNHEKLLEITEEEKKIIKDESILVGLAGMKVLLNNKNIIVEEEIVNFIKNSIEKIKFNLENDEEANRFKQKNKEFEEIHNSLLSGFSENEELVLEFIKECYENNMIDIETSIKLIFYVTSEKTNKMTIVLNNVKEEKEEDNNIKITENKEDISSKLIELFARYGYDYNKLDNKTKKNLEKYGKIDYCEEIFEFLNKNNLSENDLISHQGIISKLLIFPDNEVLNNINNFINNNSCTLPTILSLGGIFFSRTRKFQFRDKNDKPYIPPKNGFFAPCGQYRSFLFCIELYKKAKGKPSDYKMTDEDFVKENNVGMKIFFSTPEEKIKRNLFLLEKYGYINEGELPKALVSLAGKNTEYLLDRLIESGLHEYGKRYSSILIENDFPFRWYKIKRANDLRMSLYDRGGIRSELRNDNKSYMGIDWKINQKKQIITQEQMKMGDLAIGGRTLPTYKREKMLQNMPTPVREDLLPDEVALNEFKHFYEYSVFTPSDIYRYNPFETLNKEKGLLIRTIFNLDYKSNSDSTYNEEDYYVELLDKKYRVNALTYSFSKMGIGGWPDVNILISRLKVVRLINLLKEQNSWINESTSELDKENLLLSIIVKDTILSKNDLNMLRAMIRDIVLSSKKKIGRGIE